MKAESIQIAESIFINPSTILLFETPQTYNNMTIIPIIVQESHFFDFITIKEAEELELIDILETDSVNQLKVVNKSDKNVLIPFGMTVHGGKQDRTIWEPILLPPGEKHEIFSSQSTPTNTSNTFNVPAKCIEQSRWHYKESQGFKSSNQRLHPNVAFEAMSSAGQGGVWNEIQSHRAEMHYSGDIAPTQSYLDMTEKSQKKTEEFVKHFNIVKNQCGIVCFINNEFIGIEFYANNSAWNSLYEDILNAFAIEALRFRDKPIKEAGINYFETFRKVMKKLTIELSVRKGVGLGDVVEFNSNNNKTWRGITLIHKKTPIHFYLVSKRGGSNSIKQSRTPHFQTNINNRVF
jgi:hypothetical protein